MHGSCRWAEIQRVDWNQLTSENPRGLDLDKAEMVPQPAQMNGTHVDARADCLLIEDAPLLGGR